MKHSGSLTASVTAWKYATERDIQGGGRGSHWKHNDSSSGHTEAEITVVFSCGDVL